MVNKNEVIIVLGNKLTDNGHLSLQCRERCFCAYEIYKNNKNSFLILSGGVTNNKINKSEAKAMEEYMLELGVLKTDIILEEKSLNTFQNAKFCYEILKNIYTKRRILVSGSEHIYRWSFNPVRFFNADFNLNVEYKACLDSNIECISYEREKESIFIIVRNKDKFLEFIENSSNINVFYKFKGLPYKNGDKTIAYNNKDKLMFENIIKKLYNIETIKTIEI